VRIETNHVPIFSQPALGNVDSGKSTLIGVLSNGILDDGRGGARSHILKHRHEQENGRTSTVTVEIIGYKGDEQIIPTSRNHAQRWRETMEKADHSVTLIDLCGHEKVVRHYFCLRIQDSQFSKYLTVFEDHPFWIDWLDARLRLARKTLPP